MVDGKPARFVAQVNFTMLWLSLWLRRIARAHLCWDLIHCFYYKLLLTYYKLNRLLDAFSVTECEETRIKLFSPLTFRPQNSATHDGAPSWDSRFRKGADAC